MEGSDRLSPNSTLIATKKSQEGYACSIRLVLLDPDEKMAYEMPLNSFQSDKFSIISSETTTYLRSLFASPSAFQAALVSIALFVGLINRFWETVSFNPNSQRWRKLVHYFHYMKRFHPTTLRARNNLEQIDRHWSDEPLDTRLSYVAWCFAEKAFDWRKFHHPLVLDWMMCLTWIRSILRTPRWTLGEWIRAWKTVLVLHKIGLGFADFHAMTWEDIDLLLSVKTKSVISNQPVDGRRFKVEDWPLFDHHFLPEDSEVQETEWLTQNPEAQQQTTSLSQRSPFEFLLPWNFADFARERGEIYAATFLMTHYDGLTMTPAQYYAFIRHIEGYERRMGINRLHEVQNVDDDESQEMEGLD